MLDQWQRNNNRKRQRVGYAEVSPNKQRVTLQKGRSIEERKIKIKKSKNHNVEEPSTPISKKIISLYTILSSISAIIAGYFIITQNFSI